MASKKSSKKLNKGKLLRHTKTLIVKGACAGKEPTKGKAE